MSEDATKQPEETVEVRREELLELSKKLSHPRRVLRNSAKYAETWEDSSRAKKGREQVENVRNRLKELQSVGTGADRSGGGNGR